MIAISFKMLISIIIPTFNSSQTIQNNLDSIKKQTYLNYEIVVIDNNSTDDTITLIKKNNFKNIKTIIEKDSGIYDAVNKGILNSTGDLVSILHSDDIYNHNDVLKNVVNAFNQKKNVEIVYGDLVYVKNDDINSVLRYWKPGKFKNDLFLKGWHPPHPSFFAKKRLFDSYGLYNSKIGNSADVELMHRFMQIFKINFYYLNETLVKMRYGGKSNKNIMSIIRQNLEIIKFLNIQNSLYKIIIFFSYKFIDRLKQFIVKK